MSHGDRFVERYERRADALARQVDLVGTGFLVTIEWEAARRLWRLVYWKEAGNGDQ